MSGETEVARSRWPARRRRDAYWLMTGLAGTAVVAAMAWPALRLDLYFDEAWRADMVRTPWTFDRYFLHDTPLPPGWLVTMWSVFEVLPTRRPLMKLVALVPLVVASLTTCAIINRLAVRRLPQWRARMIAAATVVLTLLLPGIAHLAVYFNNYAVDIAVGAALLWACVALESSDARDRTRAVVLVVCVACVGPFVSQGALFVMPSVLGLMAVRARRRSDRALMRSAVTAAALFLAASIACFVVFLRRVADTTAVVDFWRGESVEGLGLAGWLDRWWLTFQNAVIPRTFGTGAVASVATVTLLVVGVIVATKVFPFWLVAVGSAQALAIVASALVGWPLTIVRLNIGFHYFVVVLVPLGFVVSIDAALVRMNVGRLVFTASFAATIVVASVLAWPGDVRDAATSESVFARGLTNDLGYIADRASSGDVVLGYHVMSSWYLHDRLVNDSNVSILLLDELSDGALLIDDPDSLVAQRAPRASTVWCVIPYEVGPDASAEACELDPANWQRSEDVRLQRARVTRWKRR